MDLVERLMILEKAHGNTELQSLHLELCRRDVSYWFNNFCWTTNPREQYRDIPFNLYPFQEWCIEEWLGCIDSQQDIGVEKSRDMGVTWMMILLFQWCWLFKPGYSFHVGSKREDEVDDGLISPDSTIFGKWRYNFMKLPPWMKPDHNDKRLSILNHDNNNILTGESANPAFGRSRRYRAILLDELAFWEAGEPAFEGCADTTNCRIVISTPYGESNAFYRIMHDERNEYRPCPEEKELRILKGVA